MPIRRLRFRGISQAVVVVLLILAAGYATLFTSDDEATETTPCRSTENPVRPGWLVVMDWTYELTLRLSGRPQRELATIASSEAARHHRMDDLESQERAACWRALMVNDQITAADVAHELAVDRARRGGVVIEVARTVQEKVERLSRKVSAGQQGQGAVANIPAQHGVDADGFGLGRALGGCNFSLVAGQDVAQGRLLGDTGIGDITGGIDQGFQITRPFLGVDLLIEGLAARRDALAPHHRLPFSPEFSDRRHCPHPL